MFDFSSHQIVILFAGLGLVGFGVIALAVSFFWPRKKPVAQEAVQSAVPASSGKGDIVVSIVPPASSAILSTAASGTLLVSRRDAFVKPDDAPVAETIEPLATVEAPALAVEEPVAVASAAVSPEASPPVRVEDLSMLEDLYAEMFALRSSIGELSRDIESLRSRLDQSLEPARSSSKRRDRSRAMQVQPAA